MLAKARNAIYARAVVSQKLLNMKIQKKIWHQLLLKTIIIICVSGFRLSNENSSLDGVWVAIEHSADSIFCSDSKIKIAIKGDSIVRHDYTPFSSNDWSKGFYEIDGDKLYFIKEHNLSFSTSVGNSWCQRNLSDTIIYKLTRSKLNNSKIELLSNTSRSIDDCINIAKKNRLSRDYALDSTKNSSNDFNYFNKQITKCYKEQVKRNELIESKKKRNRLFKKRKVTK